jgi:hypothetical protein
MPPVAAYKRIANTNERSGKRWQNLLRIYFIVDILSS